MNLSHLFKFLLIFSIFFTGCEENFPYEDILDLSGAVSKELPEGEDLNGYEAVDLGLPSGIKWATCNVGATSPGDYGKRYAWGEIKEKDYYNWDIYKWAKGSSTTLTKYCTDSSNGTVDGKKYLDLEDDVAHATWGGSWRMPTAAEFEELRNECSWYWTYENGTDGYRVTSRTNGNSIFLPTDLYSSGSPMYGDYDYYWSSSKGSSDSYARCLYIYKSSASITIASRYINYPIRPVSGDRIKFSVSVNSAGNGTVAIKGDSLTSAAFKEASAVTVTATPDSGFEFKGWFVGDADAPVSADAEYTFTVYENVALVAKFVKPATVTVSSAGNGAVEIKGNAENLVKFEDGASVTVVATPDDGYVFSGWFVGNADSPVSTDAEYTFVIKENIELVAKFIKGATVKVVYTGSGSVKIDGKSVSSLMVGVGSTVTVTAIPGSGYKLNGWFVADEEDATSTDAEYTFTVNEDISLVAMFIKLYEVSVSSSGNGTVAISGCTDLSVKYGVGSTITVVATPDSGFEFKGWFIGDAAAPMSTETEYSFTVVKDIALVARFKQPFDNNGHEYVDLGLPSGIKWATCNVGATKPEEFGNYYAWGEINTKESYADNNSLTYKKSSYNIEISGNVKYDAASYCWKGTWRMPTRAEFNELVENCAWEWTAVNGVDGYKVTSTVNGNSIFLPAAGYKWNTGSYSGSYYWSGSYYNSTLNYSSYSFYFRSGYYSVSYDDRYYGYPIRPVCE